MKNHISQIKIGAESTNKKLFTLLIGLSIFALLVYMYYIGAIVFNVIARKNIENENKAIASIIAEMQVDYLSKIGSIDKSFALRSGYEDPTKPSYVTSQSLVGMLR